MRIRIEMICATGAMALLMPVGTKPAAAQTTVVFRNEKVAVTKVVVAPGAEAPLDQDHPAVIVFLGGRSAELIRADGSKRTEEIERGKTEEEQPGRGALRNSGTGPLIFVRVAFLTGGSDAMWGASGLAPNYNLLLEDRYSRTYDIKMPAHGSEPLHSHHDRVVVCLSGAQLEHILPDGSRQPSTLKTDEIGWRLAQTHRGRNLGNTNLWVIAIEPK